MNNNLCIIRGGYSYCSCTSRESQITLAVLGMNIHQNATSLKVSLGFPHWLGNSPRCSRSFHNRSHGAPVPAIRDPSSSEGRLECPPRAWYSPENVTSKFTLHILSDTPGGSQRLKYILLMYLYYILHFAAFNCSILIQMPRIPSTIQNLFRICRLMTQHQHGCTLSAV